AQEMHAAIPGSHLVLFERCGHWPQHEHAPRFNALAIGFIRRNAVSDPGDVGSDHRTDRS
ncbi:MAG: alpha/beta fold hydrolase, partial [Nitrososphaerales archaeon]